VGPPSTGLSPYAVPPAIRILPLNREEEFQDCQTPQDVQRRYFLDQLPFGQGGRYYYRDRGLDAEPGTVVLFQCDRTIIASAVFLHSQRFEKPVDGKYNGALDFDVGSIKVFEPIEAAGLKKVWPTFDRFSHVKQALPPGMYQAFEQQLKGVETPGRWLRPEEADASESIDAGNYIPQAIDRRQVVERQIRERRGQGPFRDNLRKRCGDRCQVTGCEVLAVLEAAHISPYRGEDDNHPTNGLLLRADIHTLFDLDLLGIEPTELRVELHPHVKKEYGYLADRTLVCTAEHQPSHKAMQQRYERFRQRLAASKK
jgi:HNH endonuclease